MISNELQHRPVERLRIVDVHVVRSILDDRCFVWRQALVRAIAHVNDRTRGLAELRAAYADPSMGHWVGMLNMALLAAHFDDAELSLAALRRAVPHAPSGHGIWSFVWLPLMQPVRAHPEFETLVRASGLPGYWREAGWPEHCRPLGDDGFECS